MKGWRFIRRYCFTNDPISWSALLVLIMVNSCKQDLSDTSQFRPPRHYTVGITQNGTRYLPFSILELINCQQLFIYIYICFFLSSGVGINLSISWTPFTKGIGNTSKELLVNCFFQNVNSIENFMKNFCEI